MEMLPFCQPSHQNNTAQHKNLSHGWNTNAIPTTIQSHSQIQWQQNSSCESSFHDCHAMNLTPEERDRPPSILATHSRWNSNSSIFRKIMKEETFLSLKNLNTNKGHWFSHDTVTHFSANFWICIVLNGSNFQRHIPWWNIGNSKFQLNIHSVVNFWGENSFLLFILLKKIWLNLWFITALCKTPMEFPATIPVSTQPMLFATMATLSVLIVSMRLGSFMYSTFDSHHSKSGR